MPGGQGHTRSSHHMLHGAVVRWCLVGRNAGREVAAPCGGPPVIRQMVCRLAPRTGMWWATAPPPGGPHVYWNLWCLCHTGVWAVTGEPLFLGSSLLPDVSLLTPDLRRPLERPSTGEKVGKDETSSAIWMCMSSLVF